ncbi:MAG: YggS family pyridoxal phosphate-dependent enzyme [Deltaproteobacteria bacterium]|nr:MAG: YggS family pyridoxal phosphate-dependent enzyme [Deltaproteobacteria bacterium]
MNPIADNLRYILDQIAAAAQRVGRQPDEVKLVAVSKTVDLERMRRAIAAGVKILGENYLQEAQTKIAALGQVVSWHFIGNLQTNKAAGAVAGFDLIHSVDRLKLAQALEKAAQKLGKIQEILIEVNLAGEASKSGVAPEDAAALIEAIAALPHLRLRGLMTMPPWFNEPEAVRPYFKQLRELKDRLSRSFPEIQLSELSMGMSGDFEAAIAEGATLVRIGTAIFGARPGA